MSETKANGQAGGADVRTMTREHKVACPYWDDKAVDLESIDMPAYVVASYTNPIHTYGTLEGFRRISSADKWLRIHNTGEWDDYYDPEHVEDLRRFSPRTAIFSCEHL